MAFSVNLQVTGLDKVQATMRKLSSSAIQEATVKAINDTAFLARSEMQRELAKVFDRPTPYILRSVQVQKATAGKLEAIISPTYMGGKGVDPQKILRAEVEGGQRRLKRFEVALQRVGILPAGYVTRIPADPFPGSDDGRGNLRGPFLVQLLSYFKAFGEQGYKMNMSEKRRKKLHNIGTSANGYKAINGVVYFVTYGGLRSGPGQHLKPGIWAKSGTHGVNVRPVVIFIKSHNYQSRLSMDGIVKQSDLQGTFEKKLRYHIRKAAGE